ncbi:hypothetical protein A4H97_33390 [Niastella yeongjuensis]|uniref:Uncharacterized protein n=1 Tax=Niastella yeongjuensis TaxID=354355 RepID=A0A1V9EDQ5_9BACT|nr:hypothetical protein [Niastella yeongjuensis]OQP44249.1 hypothetical protein A4H97_33390 [Niastella yeongjuensis]SEO41146.1 hypothetical protein SAMN05660816_02852 [Niastella yeongjuensis]
MNEPLNTSRPGISFSGKSYNKHPQWYNQPLRLSEEQLNNPILVFDDFFQGYHLNETREVLWQWLLAVISSDGSIASEPLERSNHIYFYEKLEEVLEAAFVIKTNQPAGEINTPSTRTTHPESNPDAGEIFNKEKRLIEYVNDDPLYVIGYVFNPAKWYPNCLKEWVEIALVSEDDAYWNADDRQTLVTFMDHLHFLIESLYIINLQRISDSSKKEWGQKVYTPHLLSKQQAGNPRQVIMEFFEKYPMVYIMRELEDLLEAGISHTGPW